MSQMIQVIEFAGNNPWLNLAREEYLLLHHPKKSDDIFLIFYENCASIILGRSLIYEKEVYRHKKHPPVLRRLSGGGAVNHFNGNLNYGLLLNIEEQKMANINQSYQTILQALTKGFAKHTVLQGKGISDICLNQAGNIRKISGNAQVRKRGWLLHHGTFLYDLRESVQIKNFLRMPEKQPEYRAQRTHDDFLVRAVPVHSKPVLQTLISQSFANAFARSLVCKGLPKGADKFIRENLLLKYLTV